MAGRPLVVGPAEAAHAINLLNQAIPGINLRENRYAAVEIDDGPVGGINFLSGSRYQVLFRDLRTGKIYGIVAPNYEPYVTQPLMSCRRVPLDPTLVRRVERVRDLEQPNDIEPD